MPLDFAQPLTGPHCYRDASDIPYSVVPDLVGVNLGDYGLVIRNATGAKTPLRVRRQQPVDVWKKPRTRGMFRVPCFSRWGKQKEGDFSVIVFPGSGSGKMNDKGAAKGVVQTKLGSVSADHEGDLAGRLASNVDDQCRIGPAMALAGAPEFVPPPPDAVTAAGAIPKP